MVPRKVLRYVSEHTGELYFIQLVTAGMPVATVAFPSYCNHKTVLCPNSEISLIRMRTAIEIEKRFKDIN